MKKQYASTESFEITWVPIYLMSKDPHIEWLKEQETSKKWMTLMLDKTINSSVKLSHKETIKKPRHENPFWIGGKY